MEGNGKIIFDNGEYYIGQLKNNKRHGKGVEYSKDGKIIFEGDWVEGKVKFNFDNGEYYIGEWSNGQPNGKGILYYGDGKIKNEGNFVNGKCGDNN